MIDRSWTIGGQLAGVIVESAVGYWVQVGLAGSRRLGH